MIPPAKSVRQAFKLFQGVASHWDAYLRAGKEPPLEVTRSVFETAELVLRTYIASPSRSREAFPIELAYLIANQMSASEGKADIAR